LEKHCFLNQLTCFLKTTHGKCVPGPGQNGLVIAEGTKAAHKNKPIIV